MKDSHYGHMVVFIELVDQLHDLNLMMHIQRRGGLIQQNNIRLLGNGPGDDHTLLLTILVAQIRISAHEHNVLSCKIIIDVKGLRYHCYHLRALALLETSVIPSAHYDPAACDGQKTRKAFEQCGFTGTI